MRKISIFSALFLLVFSANALPDDGVEVEEIGFGMYLGEYDNFKIHPFFYRVDTVSQLCFVVPTKAGTVKQEEWTLVPCENLAKRDEWKDIITWVNN